MVKKIKEFIKKYLNLAAIRAAIGKAAAWLKARCTLRSFGDLLYIALIVLVVVLALALLVSGCSKKTSSKPAAEAAPAAQTNMLIMDEHGNVFPLPFDSKPDVLCLRVGQSAEILEDVEVKARIPFREDERELWVGRVVLPKGVMVVKPLVEQ